jgi:UDP-N-acetylmuramate-alanine ligase
MFSEIRSVHFVGICGTAMASTAAALKQKGYAVTATDQQIDQLVYELYGLTEDEIKLVEGNA